MFFCFLYDDDDDDDDDEDDGILFCIPHLTSVIHLRCFPEMIVNSYLRLLATGNLAVFLRYPKL